MSVYIHKPRAKRKAVQRAKADDLRVRPYIANLCGTATDHAQHVQHSSAFIQLEPQVQMDGAKSIKHVGGIVATGFVQRERLRGCEEAPP